MFDTRFWIALAFVIFCATIGVMVVKKIIMLIDKKRDEIKESLDKAERLKKEAEEINAKAVKKQKEAEKKAKELIDTAHKQAKLMIENSKAEIEHKLQKRLDSALDRIKAEENNFTRELKEKSIQLALESIKTLVKEREGKLTSISNEEIEKAILGSKSSL